MRGVFFVLNLKYIYERKGDFSGIIREIKGFILRDIELFQVKMLLQSSFPCSIEAAFFMYLTMGNNILYVIGFLRLKHGRCVPNAMNIVVVAAVKLFQSQRKNKILICHAP